jgi:hypothetical protein
MSGGGGKGGSTTTEVKIPEWLQSAAQGNIRRAEDVAALGNIPYYGPDVAAMTPMQIAAGQGINTAAGAFGLGTNDLSMGIPAPQTFAGGVQGYSSGNLYDQALRELQLRAPAQYNAITGMFINPQTGSTPLSFGQNVPAMVQGAPAAPLSYGDIGGGGGGGGGGSTGGGSAGGVGGRSLSDLAMIAGSYLPGGMNTNRPFSLLNTIAADVRNAISPQRAPTSADRPPPSPNRPAGVTTSKVTTSKPAASKPGSTRF